MHDVEYPVSLYDFMLLLFLCQCEQVPDKKYIFAAMYHFLSSSGPNEPMYRCENNSRMLLHLLTAWTK